MKTKLIKFIQELHRRLHQYRKSGRSTFVTAESMDDYCFTIGYASCVAAFEDLNAQAREYIHMSRNKANPILYMAGPLVACPPHILFKTTEDVDGNGNLHFTPILDFGFTEGELNRLRSDYIKAF